MVKSLDFSLTVMGSHWIERARERHNLMAEAGRPVRRQVFNQEIVVAWTSRGKKWSALRHHFLMESGALEKERNDR